METPSSTRRITRSQAMSASANSNTKTSRKFEDSEKSVSKSRQMTEKQDRCVLIDITNDSPIVGLASGSLNGTPISSFSKQRRNVCKKTPGSGEALLRGQVKNLLQKVEEEAEISKFCLENCGPVRLGFKAIFNSPAGLVAPTPVNTPQVVYFSAVEEFDSLSSVSEPPIEDQLRLPQMMSDEKQADIGSEDVMISRALFLEFSEKSDSSSDSSSVVTYQGTIGGVESDSQDQVTSIDEDDASVWSIQVNVSTQGEDEVNQDVVEEDDIADNEEYYDEGGVEEEDEMLFLDDLCEGISNISVVEEKKGPKFMGKHKKFVYNSDDELVEAFEEYDSAEVLRLKGLPTPKGKHVRFLDEE
ncbi:uncharacterized protein [Spinacia oleracea]|uniref:Uncharacterized protein n=1 Tax=Spinacia oleracea TaxID=3562 RepID=A0A9R0HVS7_SPIOL|nr:uncharacterized protein LOC110776527 [Spinacia oleracea]